MTTPNAPTAAEREGARVQRYYATVEAGRPFMARSGDGAWVGYDQYAALLSALLAARRETENARSALERSREETNAWKCDQCGYLVKHLRHEPPDWPCPNDGTLLRALSWRDLAEAEAALNRRLIGALPDDDEDDR